jgi:NDP-sugar pyrophosphorylase family protein
MGIYIFEPRVLDYIPNNEYLDFPDLVKILLANGERVIGYPYSGYWRDLGNPKITRKPASILNSCVPSFYRSKHGLARSARGC